MRNPKIDNLLIEKEKDKTVFTLYRAILNQQNEVECRPVEAAFETSKYARPRLFITKESCETFNRKIGSRVIQSKYIGYSGTRALAAHYDLSEKEALGNLHETLENNIVRLREEIKQREAAVKKFLEAQKKISEKQSASNK